jgi:putative addiction module component (TIGR02574 family)
MIRAEDAMSPSISDLGIDKLSRQDRLRLVDEILETLGPAEPGPVDLSEAHWREIEARLDEADANPDDCSPWEEVLARLQARRSRL